MLVGYIIGYALPTLLAGWVLTLIVPISFSQALWLSVAVLFATRYILQNITDLPGFKNADFVEVIVAIVIAFLLLAVSTLLGWLLWRFTGFGLTIFEATLLCVLSLMGGFFFSSRSGTGGLPVWMTLVNPEDEGFEEDYIVSPPKRRSRPRSRAGRRN